MRGEGVRGRAGRLFKMIPQCERPVRSPRPSPAGLALARQPIHSGEVAEPTSSRARKWKFATPKYPLPSRALIQTHGR